MPIPHGVAKKGADGAWGTARSRNELRGRASGTRPRTEPAAVRFFIFVGVCIERQVDQSIGRLGSLFNRPPLLVDELHRLHAFHLPASAGTRIVLVRSSRPRGRRPRPAAERDLGGPALQRTGPQGTHDVPDSNGPAAGGVIQGPGPRAGQLGGCWAGPKLERVEFPAFGVLNGTRRAG